MLNFQSIGVAFEYCWTFCSYFMKELKLSAVFDRFTFCIRIRFRSGFIPKNFFLRSKLCIGPRKVPESPGKDREKLGRPQLSGTKSKLVHWKWIYIKIYFVLNWVNQVFFRSGSTLRMKKWKTRRTNGGRKSLSLDSMAQARIRDGQKQSSGSSKQMFRIRIFLF